ncbi:MAG TPA: DUF4192 domain-containing protein [Pseudonocardiaceae bacterium]|nr:DUF4192 domain-containing protein [Pseudonocardiaceae bacterium]
MTGLPRKQSPVNPARCAIDITYPAYRTKLGSCPISITSDNPAAVLAAVPALLGFYPINSLVAIGLPDITAADVPVVLRMDPPRPDNIDEMLRHLVLPLAQHQVNSVVLVIVADDSDPAWRAVLLECVSLMQAVDIAVVMQIWTNAIQTGWRWWCGQELAYGGVQGEIAATTASMVSAGWPVSARREDIAVPLAADPAAALARRASLLAAQQQDPTSDPAKAGRALLDRVRSALDTTSVDDVALTDVDVVELTVALADHRVRDACLHIEQLADQLRAERLWTALTRATPAPHRAEPASMLAFLAYSRGHSVLAGIAITLAEAANPDHGLSGLLRSALTIGLKPDRIMTAGALAAQLAEEALGT